MPEHGEIIVNGGKYASDVTTVDCRPLYKLSVPEFTATCGYDGQWHYSSQRSAACELVIPYVIAIILCGCVVLLVVLLLIMYKYRFELKLYSYKYCSCCLCCCKCFRRFPESNKTNDTFLSYHHTQRAYVDSTLYQPLLNANYSTVVDYDHPQLRVGANLFKDFAELINDSASLIAVVDQEFINSQWCMYEYEEGLQCQLDDPTFQIIVILMQPLASLRNVPFWLRRTIEVHLYIEHNDPMLLGKLRQSLRNPTGRHRDQVDDVEPDVPLMPVVYDAEEDEIDEEFNRVEAELRRNHTNDRQPLLLA